MKKICMSAFIILMFVFPFQVKASVFLANLEAGVIIQYVSDLSIDIATSDEDFSMPVSCQKLHSLSENVSDELCAKVVYESKGQTTCPEIRALQEK